MYRDHDKMRVEAIKARYPAGTRLELLHMNDPYAPVPPGTRGSVAFCDDAGQVHMRWDNGRTLALIPGEDGFRKLTTQELEQEQLSDEQEVFTQSM